MHAVHQSTSGQGKKSARHDTKPSVRPSYLVSPPTAEPTPVIQRTCACGGGCPPCQEKLTQQPKLAISSPNDKYEEEADHIADQVMRMPESSVQMKPT